MAASVSSSHRSFGQRKQHDFVGRRRRTLGRGIELADRLDFVAEKLDANRPVHFRRIHVEQSAAMSELPRHLDHVHLVVADDAQVLDQPLGIDHLAATHDFSQVGVKLGIAQRIAVAASGVITTLAAPVAIFHKAVARAS